MYKINYNKIKVLYIIPVITSFSLLPFFLFMVLFNGTDDIFGEIYNSSTEATFLKQNCNYDNEFDDIMCSNIYTYKVNNQIYTCGENYTFNSGREMTLKENKIYYDSKNPENCMVEYQESNIVLPFLPFLLPFILFDIAIIIYIKKEIKRLKQLETTGTLIKDLPYTLEKMGKKSTHRLPVVYYKLPYGETVKLRGNQHSTQKYKDNPTIQLLIDMNNPKNYYLDFDIYK